MNLTTEQRDTISRLQDELTDYLWNHLYYGDKKVEVEKLCEGVVSLYDEGVELNFDVKLSPYEGINHKD